jgi:CRISPR-associated endonuclease/helicase Cas3
MMSGDYWGHSQNGQGAGVPESLCAHLTGTAERAGGFAQRLGIASHAKAAGLLHDLGKYADQMQRRLKGGSEPGRDHWSIGAYAALLTFKKRELAATAIAAAIEGHHTGLPILRSLCDHAEELSKSFKTEPDRFTDTDLEKLRERFFADGFAPLKLDREESLGDDTRGAS